MNGHFSACGIRRKDYSAYARLKLLIPVFNKATIKLNSSQSIGCSTFRPSPGPSVVLQRDVVDVTRSVVDAGLGGVGVGGGSSEGDQVTCRHFPFSFEAQPCCWALVGGRMCKIFVLWNCSSPLFVRFRFMCFEFRCFFSLFANLLSCDCPTSCFLPVVSDATGNAKVTKHSASLRI